MMGALQKVMPLINPSVRFFGIGVKSHDVTTVDEPFRYSIPPLSRSASFHSFYSCPEHTMKLRLWNLTKRGHAVITKFLSCSLIKFGWLLSFAGPNLIFLNIRNQPHFRGEGLYCGTRLCKRRFQIEANGVTSSKGNLAILIDQETLQGFR